MTKPTNKKIDAKGVLGKVERLILENLTPDSEKIFLEKIIPMYNAFFGKYSSYALYKTRVALKDMLTHNFKLYFISQDQFFPVLYKKLENHYSIYSKNVRLKMREKKIEQEDVDGLFHDFLSEIKNN
jgi:hypothetical protein